MVMLYRRYGAGAIGANLITLKPCYHGVVDALHHGRLVWWSLRQLRHVGRDPPRLVAGTALPQPLPLMEINVRK
jgi:hypothetical protein